MFLEENDEIGDSESLWNEIGTNQITSLDRPKEALYFVQQLQTRFLIMRP